MSKYPLLAAAIVLTACSGSSDPAPPAQSHSPPVITPPSPPDAAGVWAGTFLPNPSTTPDLDALCRITAPNAVPNEVTCVFFQQGEVAAALSGTPGTFEAAVDDDDWQHTGMFYDFGHTSHAASLTSGHIDGTGADREIELVHSLDYGTSFRVVAEDVDQSRLSSPSAAGVYQVAYMRGVLSSFSIAADGAVFSQGGGCTINGFANSLSMYGYFMQLQLSNCGIANGRYEGFGILSRAVFAAGSAGYTDLFAFAVFGSGGWMGGHALR